MPESSDKSHSHEKEDQQLPKQDLQGEPPDSVGGNSMPEASESDQKTEKKFSTDEQDNAEEYPSWLFELESTAVNAPIEVIHKESDQYLPYSTQGNDSEEISAEAKREDLPEWLKQDHNIKPEVEHQNIPEDEWPDWLTQGLEEMSLPPDDQAVTTHREGATKSMLEPGQVDPAEVDDRLNQERTSIAPEAQDDEPLAEVRLALKDAEQSKVQEEHPGLLTKMTGWLLASSQLKQDPSEQPAEDRPGIAGTEPLEARAEVQEPDMPPEISAQLLASRLGDYDESSQQDDEALSQLVSSIFIDEIDETQTQEHDADAVDTFTAEIKPKTTGDEQPIDKELRREILSEIESSNQAQTSKSGEEGKAGKGFLKGIFGSKKIKSSQMPAISDQEIERRLLIGLSAAGISETQQDDSSSYLPNEATDEVGPGSLLFQDEDTESTFQTETTDEESHLEEQEIFYPAELEEFDEQPDGQESLLNESELSLADESPEQTNGGESYTELRELALQDYDESPRPPEASPLSIFIQKIIHQIEDLSPLQKITVAMLLIVDVGFMVLLAAILTFSNFTAAVVPPATAAAPIARIEAPFPTQAILPGGWSFGLKPGSLRNGSWANEGAEWLQGTEITRWLALPWSKQLEAVVVTFGPDEQIELVMSNLDRVKYKVESVQEVPVEKVLELNRNTPSLVLILANKNSDTRLVVIGSLISDGQTETPPEK